jgi:hypothetical protein
MRTTGLEMYTEIPKIQDVKNGRFRATLWHVDPLFRTTWHTIYACSAGMHGTTGTRDRTGQHHGPDS